MSIPALETSPQTKIVSNRWVTTSWEEYTAAIASPEHEKSKGYFYQGKMRLEMSPLGNPHSRDHAIVMYAVHLFAAIHNLDLDGHDNCSYRKTGKAKFDEAQPDASFYIGENANAIPWDSTIIDLDIYPAPDLVIEVASSSLADDKGQKRLLYEKLDVTEYWIIDVLNVEVLAFTIADGGSRKIDTSQVLPNLKISLLEEAFRRSRQTNHGKVGAWLLTQFQEIGDIY